MAKKKEVKQTYTVDERIRRVWDIEEIKDLMCRRAFYYANNDRRGELVNCWVGEPKHLKTASFGSNWGYYVGMDEISSWYVVQHDQQMKDALKAIHAKHPEIEETLANQGWGCHYFSPMSTPMVILSGDGETAKGMWYCIGNESVWSGEDEADCWWMNGRVAADFVKEDGQWKIWHLVISNDLAVRAGENADDLPTKPEPGTYKPELDFGEPTIKMVTHNMAMNWSDNYPQLPNPYYRYDAEEGYGPMGHPDFDPEF